MKAWNLVKCLKFDFMNFAVKASLANTSTLDNLSKVSFFAVTIVRFFIYFNHTKKLIQINIKFRLNLGTLSNTYHCCR